MNKEEMERIIWDIYYTVKEAKDGDENDKQMALVDIEKLLRENNIFMPF